MRYGALEAGGTKMVMGVLNENMEVVRSTACPTRPPDETMEDILAFFEGEKLDAMGIATFGPVNLDMDSPEYGNITSTPKLAWRDYPLYKTIKEALNVPTLVDTDVNAAALAEATMGAAKGLKNILYVTVGTGVGGGLLLDGKLVHGMLHPEWGHIPLSRAEDDPLQRGICPYHALCLEGLASGPAIQSRWATPAKEIPVDHRAWDLESYYLAQLCVTALMTVSVERIILGGGVMHQETLFPKIRAQVKDMLGGYLQHPRVENLEELIVPPALYPDSGLIGAGLLAKAAL
ncbi:MAG: ROK family protein [Eubacteriales bacterium]|nr:ROK family protein [Eubacteriales bacterium]